MTFGDEGGGGGGGGGVCESERRSAGWEEAELRLDDSAGDLEGFKFKLGTGPGPVDGTGNVTVEGLFAGGGECTGSQPEGDPGLGLGVWGEGPSHDAWSAAPLPSA
eukprot:409489-Rhodomonas_salina.4